MRALSLTLALACVLIAPMGCGESVPPPGKVPREKHQTGLERVSVLVSAPDTLLAADVSEAPAVLLDSEGSELWRRDFPNESVVVAKLAPDGGYAFLATKKLNASLGAQAVLISRNGEMVWESREETIPGFFDGCFSEDGKRFVSYFVPEGLEGRSAAYEIISLPDGEVLPVQGREGSAVALAANNDLSRVVVSYAAGDPTGLQPCDSTVVRYEDGRQLEPRDHPATFTTASLSHSGSLFLEMVDGVSLRMSKWPDTPLWTMQSEFVAQAQFSEDDELLLTAGMSSTQTQLAQSYNILVQIRDASTGDTAWQDTCESSTVLFPVASADLSRIALVPIGADGDGFIYTRSGSTWTRDDLPEGTATVCFGEDEAIFLGNADGTISVY